MTQAVVDAWNTWTETALVRETLGVRLIEADEEHALFEIRETAFNKIWGYFGGYALLAVLEMVGGTRCTATGRASRMTRR
jgi:L-asparagine transporter-like permease